ncbi:MAG: ABC transporter permease, partial [Firmicutes bacterium]|nr:ABC transporter permease [Bacillota bacterium]
MSKKQNSFASNLYIFIVMAFMYIPLLVMIIYSFNDSKSRGAWAGFTTKWYVDLFHNEAILQALWNTLVVAVISSVVATILGTAAAVGIQAMKKRNRELIMNFTYLPVMSPEIV